MKKTITCNKCKQELLVYVCDKGDKSKFILPCACGNKNVIELPEYAILTFIGGKKRGRPKGSKNKKSKSASKTGKVRKTRRRTAS